MTIKHRLLLGTLPALIAVVIVVGLIDVGPFRSGLPSAAASQHGQSHIATLSATLVVTNPADFGPGTLRQKMTAAQAGDTIVFDPAVFRPGSPATINVQAALPTLSRNNITIDASNAGVILDGSLAPGGTNGFIVSANQCVIRGLTIRNFSSNGVILTAGSANNIIGGNRLTHQGNVIVSNGGSGIDLRGIGTDGNFVWGNQIGVDASGAWALGNTYNGIAIWQGVKNNTIGSASVGYTNTIGGNQQNGVWIGGVGTDQNVVIGNFVGTRTDGAGPIGNGYSGIAVQDGAQFNRVGGTLPGEGNLISGNTDNGLYIGGAGTNNNQVLGNFIGTNSEGTARVGQGNNGIVITQGAARNTVGNGTVGGRNVISGNAYDGIRIQDATTLSNTVQGNFIGTNISGTAAIPNGLHGIELTNSTSGNLIGGRRSFGQGNLMSGNLNHGMAINFGAHHNKVSGNLIGPDVTGRYSLGNQPWGAMDITDEAHDNTVGGLLPDEGNLVSGNQTDGIALFNTSDNQLIHNVVGLALDGATPLPNARYGIFNVSGAVRTLIMSNTVAYQQYGVWITECAGNTITQNSIYSNTVKGIVVEHPCLAAPQITATATTTITGVTSPTARLEFFSDDKDQGRVYEGFMTADASGYFTFTQPGGFSGPNVTATSTANGNTSEFSRPVHLLWTVLLYLNGDNNLEDELRDTLNDLVAAGPSPRANIIALYDGYNNAEYYTGTVLYDITYGQAISIAAQLSPTLTVPNELDMGDGQTLAHFVIWGREHYPARYTLLSIVDHGGGWAPSIGPDVTGTLKHQDVWLAGNSGLSWDNTNNYDYLNSNELKEAFVAITTNGVKPVDVVFYDVCLMGMIEVAYQIKDYASFFVSSQNIGWAPAGEPGRYVRLVQGLERATTPLEMSQLVVKAYADAMPPELHPFTISALDLHQLPNVVAVIKQFGAAISQTLAITNQIAVLRTAYLDAQKIDYDGDFQIEPATDGFVDLYDFAVRASQQFTEPGVIAAAQSVTTALKTAIVAEQHRSGEPWMMPDRTWNLENVHGASVFLPLGEDLHLIITETSLITPGLILTRDVSLREMYSGDQLQFVNDTPWSALINSYYEVVSETATIKDNGPVAGLQEPDTTAPRTVITVTGTPDLQSVITLAWTAVDNQPGSGLAGAVLWHRPLIGQWTPILTQTEALGVFSFTLSTPCLNGFAVRAFDQAGNLESINSGSNTLYAAVPYCRYLPLVFR
jgi:parallel beta-helix repeat protein